MDTHTNNLDSQMTDKELIHNLGILLEALNKGTMPQEVKKALSDFLKAYCKEAGL